MNLLTLTRNLYGKLFIDFAYSIGYRFDSIELLNSKKNAHFNVISSKETEWYADTFPIKIVDHYYIFVEIMKMFRGKGSVGVCEVFKNGKHSKVKEVLREPFHLSYPNVFKYKEDIYMIPETREAHQIRLYRATSFPYCWTLDKVLWKEDDLVDSSLMFDERGTPVVLYTHHLTGENQGYIEVFAFNMEKKELTLIRPEERQMANDRPGGNSFVYEGQRYRPLQDCTRTYGENIFLYKEQQGMDEILKGGGKETLFDIITTKALCTRSLRHYTRIHTYNRVDCLEAVDLLRYKFFISKPLRRLFCKLRN